MDIVARLRAQRDFADDWRTTLAEEAADNIEKLRGDVAAYRKDSRSIAEALDDPRCDLTHTMAELIAELRAELADLQDGYSRLSRDFALAIESDSKHIAELAECREDAERYRWLREHWDDVNHPVDFIICNSFVTTLDADVDAARKGEVET